MHSGMTSRGSGERWASEGSEPGSSWDIARPEGRTSRVQRGQRPFSGSDMIVCKPSADLEHSEAPAGRIVLRMRRVPELVDLRLAGHGGCLRVEHTVKIIELLTNSDRFEIQHLHVRNRAALVVVLNDNFTVGCDVIRGLEPVGITFGLSCASI